MANVSFEKNSASDAARMLGVGRCTVETWCRNGIINCSNVGDGSKHARWQIDEDEINYILDLKKKFGSTKSAMLRYRKNWREGRKPAPVEKELQKTICSAMGVPTIVCRDSAVVVGAPNSYEQKEVEEITKTIIYARQVKARIEDCKNELSLLEKEYEDLKKEIMEAV